MKRWYDEYDSVDRLFIFLFFFVGICFFLILGMEWGRRIERRKTIDIKTEVARMERACEVYGWGEK